MLGLDPELGRGPFFGEILPAIAADAGSDAVYVPSAPFGGDLPFRPDRGVANYYGVGGYRRPLSDARMAGVRFAAECLAFANVPDDATVDQVDPLERRACPATSAAAGTSTTSATTISGAARRRPGRAPAGRPEPLPGALAGGHRRGDGRGLRGVAARRHPAAAASSCGCATWCRGRLGSARPGWRPKTAFHHLRRALAPIAVWMTDEGLGGIAVHVANDRPEPLAARLRVALYRDGEHPVGDIVVAIELPAHGSAERNVEAVLGRFVDASWAYRFGPPAQDVRRQPGDPRRRPGAAALARCAFSCGPPVGIGRRGGPGPGLH